MKKVLSLLLCLLLLVTTVAVSAASAVPGDVNCDGTANNQDLGLLQQYLNEWSLPDVEMNLDLNSDGRINNRDLARLQQEINT